MLHRRLVPPSRRVLLALVAGLCLCLAPAARADESEAYAKRASEILDHLLDERDFKPEPECAPLAECERLLARLRAGVFRVLAPSEQSQSPDLPSYLRLRRKCRSLDLVHIGTARHRLTATRNFATYKLAPETAGRLGEVMIFRAEHFIAADMQGQAAEAQPAAWPGAFVAVSVPRCRVLATDTIEEANRYAKHNPVAADEHLSELLLIDGRLFVINLVPVIAGHEPKRAWWYKLSLSEWGTLATFDRQRHRPHCEFSYRPTTLSEQEEDQAVTRGRHGG
ncbi:MAG TPA: hypothetical protein VGU20_06355 [Stellaceae bacterium]|nr:hypothetical protein [Stellaceae bacterium]